MRHVRMLSPLNAFALVGLVNAAACSPKPKGPAGGLDGDASGTPAAITPAASAAGTGGMALSDADAGAVLAVDSAFGAAVRAGDAAAVASTYAEDAVLMPPNMKPIKGRSAIQGFWGGFLKSYTVDVEMGMDEIDGRGNLSYSRGHFHMELTPKARGVPRMPPESGKYLEILRRQPDGSWLYSVDMYSPNAAAARH